MTQYLLSVHYVDGEGATPVEELEAAYADVDTLNQKLQAEAPGPTNGPGATSEGVYLSFFVCMVSI